MASNIDLFFNTSRNKRTFPEVLAEIQEYLASKYSTLITDNPEEQHQQITAYIAKYSGILYGTLWGKCADCGGIPRPVCETGQWADLPAACGEVYCRRKAPVTV